MASVSKKSDDSNTTATLNDVIEAISNVTNESQTFFKDILFSDSNIKKSFIDPFIKEISKAVIPVKLNIAPIASESKLDAAKGKSNVEYFYNSVLNYLSVIAKNTGKGAAPEGKGKDKKGAGIGGMIKQAALGLDLLADSIKKYADKKVAIGAAVMVASVSAAVYAIGKAVEHGWSGVSLTAVASAAIGMAGIGRGLSKIGKLNPAQTAKNAFAMMAIAPAILVLGPSIQRGFSGVSPIATLAAAGAIVAIGWALRASSKLSPGQVAKMGLAYMAFAPAIALLGLSLRIGWSTVKPETVIIASLGATAMAGVAKIMSKISIGQAVKGAAGLALMGASLIPLAFSLQIASKANISWESLAQLGVAILGLGALAATAGALVGLIAPGALAFTLLGLSLIPLAYGIEQLASIPFDWGQMGQVAAALLGLIGIASLAGLASPLIGLAGLAFMSLGIGLYIMGAALSNPAWASAETTAGYVTKALETLYDGLSIKHILFFGPYGLALLPFASALNIMGSAFFKLSKVAKSINLDEVAKFVASALNRFSEIEIVNSEKLKSITLAASSFASSIFALASVKDKIISMRDISDKDIEGVTKFGKLISNFMEHIKSVNEGGIGGAISNLISGALNVKTIQQFLDIRDELIKVGEIDYSQYSTNIEGFKGLIQSLMTLVNDLNKQSGGILGAIGNFISSGFNIQSLSGFLELIDPITDAFNKIAAITIDNSVIQNFGTMLNTLMKTFTNLEGEGIGGFFKGFFGKDAKGKIRDLGDMIKIMAQAMMPLITISESLVSFQNALKSLDTSTTLDDVANKLKAFNDVDYSKLQAVTKIAALGATARDAQQRAAASQNRTILGSIFASSKNKEQEQQTITNYTGQLSEITTELKNITKAASSNNVVLCTNARSYLDI